MVVGPQGGGPALLSARAGRWSGFAANSHVQAGCITNIASVAGSIKGVPNRFAYGVTKAAVVGLTKSVAADYVARGIRCNAICPGTVESPSLDQRLRAQGDCEKARQAFVARQPISRIGTPQEIADLAVYLATATYITGRRTSSMAAGPTDLKFAKGKLP